MSVSVQSDFNCCAHVHVCVRVRSSAPIPEENWPRLCAVCSWRACKAGSRTLIAPRKVAQRETTQPWDALYQRANAAGPDGSAAHRVGGAAAAAARRAEAAHTSAMPAACAAEQEARQQAAAAAEADGTPLQQQRPARALL